MMIATVINSTFFYSEESQLEIVAKTNDKTKVPKMMPNTEFTIIFNSVNEGVGGFSNAALASNFILNLLMAGSMGFLWGLLHSMQIIAHLPLINVMMPANATVLFSILIKIATIDVIPSEFLIEKVVEVT